MEILVNNVPLDFKLENENKMDDVWKALNRWVASNSSVIMSAVVNTGQGNMALDINSEVPGELSELEVPSVDRLELFVQSRQNLMFQTIEELDAYVDRVGTLLYENGRHINQSGAADLSEGLKWAGDVLAFIGEYEVKGWNEESYKLACEAHAWLYNWNDTQVKQFESSDVSSLDVPELALDRLRDLKMFTMLLLGLVSEVGPENYHEVLASFEDDLPLLLEQLSTMGEQFSQSRDREALENLEKFASILQQLITAFHYAVRDVEGSQPEEAAGFKEKLDEFRNLLREMEQFIENQDIVSLGDLLEYDMAEFLPALKPFAARF